MKRLFLTICVLSIAVISCSKKEEASQPEPETNVMLEEPTASTAGDSGAADTPEAKGQKLLEGMDCVGCHKVDAKLVGPSLQEVADKYTEADIDKLAKKIIDGGSGSWGDIPMTPHAGLSDENAKLMVQYILSLKK
ncbi:c-type cytochrome [Bergeyella cardium]|uniref:C-type cytochrome n=1 Tax=Bergeyella cardium TaxID=1585976 RepID=A0A6P1QS73_9FLAO|nr:c-type cytochrome [Bergeyella cardium]QHN64515.1 c-type cytochrome [Bergeyella cardium]WHE33807.1 c-type cytochrome [Bergeyella cardium]WHF60457.1 c-type cytochrome [Bergeyella cardium]